MQNLASTKHTCCPFSKVLKVLERTSDFIGEKQGEHTELSFAKLTRLGASSCYWEEHPVVLLGYYGPRVSRGQVVYYAGKLLYQSHVVCILWMVVFIFPMLNFQQSLEVSHCLPVCTTPCIAFLRGLQMLIKKLLYSLYGRFLLFSGQTA